MFIGWLTCIPAVLLPHSLCRSTTANAPANRQMHIASVVMRHSKKKEKTEFMKNHELKRLTILLLGLFILIGLNAQKTDKNYKPKNLDEAISQLDILLTEKDKKDIFDMTEINYTTSSRLS